jgi:hypothetical protein
MEEHSQALVAHTCNPSYSGGRDQEDCGLKSAQANGSQDPILKKPFTKKGWWSGSRCRPWVQMPKLQKYKKKKKMEESWAWWHLPVIPALGRQSQEDREFKASLGYTARPCLEIKKKKKKKINNLKFLVKDTAHLKKQIVKQNKKFKL